MRRRSCFFGLQRFLSNKGDQIGDEPCEPDDAASAGDGARRARPLEVEAEDADGKREEKHDGQVAREDKRRDIFEGRYGSARSDDRKRVEEVRADYVAERQFVLSASGGGDGRRKLGKRSARGDDRQADQQLGYAERAGKPHRAPDEDVRRRDKQHEPAGERKARAAARGRCGVSGVRRGILPVDEAVRGKQKGEEREAKEAVQARKSSAKADEHARGGGGGGDHGNRPERDDGAHRDWTDQHGDSEDRGDVEDVRAVGVAEREIGVACQSGQRGNGKLGRGRAEPDDRHPDDEWRYAKRAGDGLRSPDEAVGAPRQEIQAGGDKREG